MTPTTQREADDFEPVWNKDFPSGSCPTCGYPEKKHGCTCPPVAAPEAPASERQASYVVEAMPDQGARRVFDDPHDRVAALYPAATTASADHCTTCNGNGSHLGNKSKDCEACDGTGRAWAQAEKSAELAAIEATTASMSDGAIYESVSRRANPEDHAGAMAQVDAALGCVPAPSRESAPLLPKSWREAFWDTYPNMPLNNVKPLDALTWAEKEIADLRAALARSEESVAQYQQNAHELAEELRSARAALARAPLPTPNEREDK